LFVRQVLTLKINTAGGLSQGKRGGGKTGRCKGRGRGRGKVKSEGFQAFLYLYLYLLLKKG
jgi:hypothetical protein